MVPTQSLNSQGITSKSTSSPSSLSIRDHNSQQQPIVTSSSTSSSSSGSKGRRCLSLSSSPKLVAQEFLLLAVTIIITSAITTTMLPSYPSLLLQPAYSLDVISDEEYRCSGCNLFNDIRVDVLDMMAAAKTAGRSNAVVFIESSVFRQSLEVNATGAWLFADTSYINVSIVDCELHATSYSNSWVFSITGKLMRGSVVSIEGGRYAVSGVFGNQYLIFLGASLSLSNAHISIVLGTTLINLGAIRTDGTVTLATSSTLSLENATVSLSTSSSSVELMLSNFVGVVSISSDSSISFISNSISTTPLSSQNIIMFAGALTLSSSAVLNISSNAVVVTHRSWDFTDKNTRFINIESGSFSLSVSTGGSICTISDNTMTVDAQTASQNSLQASLLRISGCGVYSGGSLRFQRNVVTLGGSINHNGYGMDVQISNLGAVTLQDATSSLRVNSNRVEMGGNSIKLTLLYWSAIVQAASFTLSAGATLEVANNVMEAVSIPNVNLRTVLLLVVSCSSITVGDAGTTLTITRNNVVQQVGTDNIPVSATWLRSESIDVSAFATIMIEFNTISVQQHVPNYTATFYFPIAAMDGVQIDEATLTIAHNIVDYANIRTEPTGSTGIRSVALLYIQNNIEIIGGQLNIINNTVTVEHAEVQATSPIVIYLLRGVNFKVHDLNSKLDLQNNLMALHDGVLNSNSTMLQFCMIDGEKLDLRDGGSFSYSGCVTNVTLTHIAGDIAVYGVQWVHILTSEDSITTLLTFEDNSNSLSVSSPAGASALDISYPSVVLLSRTELENCVISVVRNSMTLLLNYHDNEDAVTNATVITSMVTLASSVTMLRTHVNISDNEMNITILNDVYGKTTLIALGGIDLQEDASSSAILIDSTSSMSISNSKLVVNTSGFHGVGWLRFQNRLSSGVEGATYKIVNNTISVQGTSTVPTSTRAQHVHMITSGNVFDGLEFHVRDNELTFPSASPNSDAWVALLVGNTRTSIYTCNNRRNSQPCFVHRGTRVFECVWSSSGTPGASGSVGVSIHDCSTFSQTESLQATNSTIPTSSITPPRTSTLSTTNSYPTSTPSPTPTSTSTQRITSTRTPNSASYTTTASLPPTATSTNTKTQSTSISATYASAPSTSISRATSTISCPTPTPSLTTTLRDYCLAIPSCLSKGATVRATTHTNITQIDLQQNTPSTCTTPQVDIGYGLWSASGALVVVTLSEEASLGAVVRPRSQSTAAAVWHRVGPPQSAVEYAIVEVGRNTTANISVSTTSPPPAAWCVVAVRYAGTSSLTGTTVSARLPMDEILGCRSGTPGASAYGLMTLTLVDSPPLPPNVGVVADTGVVVTSVTGAVGGVTAGIVQSGIANAMVGMLRCSEFDAEAEVDFVSNPGGWAVGRPALQHQRGSLLLVLILMSSVLFVAGCVVCVMYARGENTSTMMAAFGEARLPSLLVVPVLVSSSMALPSGTSVLLYGDSSGMDYFLALVVMVPLWAYLLLYAYRSTYGMRVGLEIIPVEVGGRKAYEPRWKRVLFFLMEPTYGPVAPTVRAQNFAADLDDDDGVLVVGQREDPEAPEPWLRRNYFFVADRRWAGYGGVEAIVGSLVDMLEGIPLTTRSVGVCVARPAAMCALLVVLMLLLVFKWPNSVRFQQYSALSVTSLLLVANVLVVVNAVVVAPDLEEAAGQLIGVVSLVIVVLSMLDLLATIISIVPALRRSMGISGSSLTASIGRMRAAVVRKKEAADIEAQPLAQPLLPITGAHDDDVGVDDNTPSEASSTGSYHVVVDTHNTEGEREMKTIKREELRRTNSPTSPSSSASRPSSSATTPNFTRKTWASKSSALSGMYRNIGDATAYEEELEAMKTPAEIEAEQMRLFTEEVMRDL